ncbi:winged helix-turn-helix domain-containing protein [Sunxiuqinia dokdonensis]|jgi:winged helix-turn-helix protein DUF2582|uniref:Winged helix-turn-helix domain-containing protein n=1 Tax=Sunxiuqinia dokdonensis TaxID=1409788 RepID=A0A0L8VCP9_9BACT|nr:winged helix-turn-helix domain-containing protein [Sunxiuqinia dokdonensis]KOH46229.1 hypothetical protein NC99_09570 [Sunxiuqinia dokdonensis]
MIKFQISANTKKIWEYLDRKGEASLREIEEQLELQEQDACLALGWMVYNNQVILHLKGRDLFAVIFD